MQHPAIRQLQGKSLHYAFCARGITSTPEAAKALNSLASHRGHELWKPSGKEFCVALSSDVLPAVPWMA